MTVECDNLIQTYRWKRAIYVKDLVFFSPFCYKYCQVKTGRSNWMCKNTGILEKNWNLCVVFCVLTRSPVFMYCAQMLHHVVTLQTLLTTKLHRSMQLFLFVYKSKRSVWFYDKRQLLSTIFVFVVQFWIGKKCRCSLQPTANNVVYNYKRFMFKEKDMYRKKMTRRSRYKYVIYFLGTTYIFSYFNATFTIVIFFMISIQRW